MSMSERKTGGEDTQMPRPKRGLNVLLIAAIITVLLILSFSGLFFLQISKGKGPQSSTSSETPTPTPTPTSIYLETPPPQAVFYDTFKNNALGWSISNTAGYYRTVKPGKLILTNTNPGRTLIESLPTNAIYDNFTVSVDLTILKVNRNDSAGIYVRGDSNLDHDYRIDLNGNGSFDIAKEYIDSKNNPQTIFLDGPRDSSALNPPGARNTITVVMNGSQLQLFLNNVKVSTVVDSDYTTGQVALFVRAGEGSSGVTVSFSRVEVDKHLVSLGNSSIVGDISYSH
jgi:3-keto-disaccharide hydrolase